MKKNHTMKHSPQSIENIILKNRQEFEKQLAKRQEYTVGEAKRITKDYIKKLYNSIE